ncbi:hypothetical protein PUN28_018319 [Cardiocondyla obscurior]|uniref:Secreted protein n=1 Tax=Cardiocondyla obscurior TaxID=286306 RepID=A0AAW2EKP8_9HYME
MKCMRVISVLMNACVALDNNSITPSSAGVPLLSFRAIYLLRVSRRPRKSVSGNLLKSDFMSKLLTLTGGALFAEANSHFDRYFVCVRVTLTRHGAFWRRAINCILVLNGKKKKKKKKTEKNIRTLTRNSLRSIKIAYPVACEMCRIYHHLQQQTHSH